MAEEQPRASPSTTDSSPGPHSPAPNQSVPAAAASYLGGAPAAFAAQADVLFVAAGGEELPAHSQFLARSCQLFAEMLDPSGGVEGRPAPGRPLRVLLRAHAAADIARALRGVYHPHEIAELATGLRGAAAYGVQLDLAAFLRCAPLSSAPDSRSAVACPKIIWEAARVPAAATMHKRGIRPPLPAQVWPAGGSAARAPGQPHATHGPAGALPVCGVAGAGGEVGGPWERAGWGAACARWASWALQTGGLLGPTKRC